MKLHLFSRPQCHLCDRLEELIKPHIDALARRVGEGNVHLVKFNIDDNAQWREMYGTRIPVLTVNEQILLEGRPDPTEVERIMRTL
jgi:hypothetical protein